MKNKDRCTNRYLQKNDNLWNRNLLQKKNK